MRLGAAVNLVGRVFRRRPTDLLPFYVLGMGITAIVQVMVFLSVVLVGLYLYATNRLSAIAENVEALDEPPSVGADEEALEAWIEDAVVAIDPALTLTSGAIVVLAALLTIVAVLVAWSAISAGQIATCFGRLRSERGLVAGVAGARRYWKSFLGLFVLELFTWIAISIGAMVLAIVGAIAFAFGSIGVVLGLLVLLVSIFGWLAAAIFVRLTFAFAPVAVVVDEVGAYRGARNAAGYVRYRKLEAAFYGLFVIGVLIAFGVFTSALGWFGVLAGTGIIYALGVVPAFDLLKTTLYGGGRGRLSPPEPVERSVIGQLRGGVRRGMAELVAFVRITPGLHAIATGALVGGGVIGWFLAAPAEGVIETSINARLEGHNPIVATLEFFGNNWSVGLTMAASGVMLAVPALSILLFNGVMIGFLGRTEADPLDLLAFIVPHGVVELPAIIIAGAVGLYFGRSFWRTWRGSASRTSLADALERGTWVLVGVGVLLFVAAVIEGFVSPYYWRILF
ncbi:stage II sporulation protein M [Halovivax gelatinilyticus]|uniref:stage II sporulation protein M n=1 Tax=Halovivax gelatinilyticus TaxID=2961597 RepID=UPI0020CA9538|nr:stage II sporulation protein M [Halovivax gelatinilyticus]